MDKIRVIKLLIYEGPRDIIEHHLKNTIEGIQKKNFAGRIDDNTEMTRGEYSIQGITIARFPEILEEIKENET